jgi:hypothetical protein
MFIEVERAGGFITVNVLHVVAFWPVGDASAMEFVGGKEQISLVEHYSDLKDMIDEAIGI